MNSKSIKKYIMSSIMIATSILAIPSVSEAASSTRTVFFEGLLDYRNKRLDIQMHDDVTSSVETREDEYVTEFMGSRRVDMKEYYRMFQPEDASKAYIPKKENAPYKWKKQPNNQNPGKSGLATKINTVPMSIAKTSNNRYFDIDDARIRLMEKSIIGSNRSEDDGPSMLTGFNRALGIIESLYGGFNGSEDFENVVKGLTWIISKDLNDKVKILTLDPWAFKGENHSTEIEDTAESSEASNSTEAQPITSTDGKVQVEVVGKGDYQAEIKIRAIDGSGKTTWESEELTVWHKVYTGFEFFQKTKVDGKDRIILKYYKPGAAPGEAITVYIEDCIQGIEADNAYMIKFIRLHDIVADAFNRAKQNKYSNGGSKTDGGRNLLTSMLQQVFDSLSGKIGILPMEEYVYNRSDRMDSSPNKKYMYGLYPTEWEEIVKMIQRPAIGISLAFISFAILRIVFLLNVESMNVDTRISVKRDIMNIIAAIGFMLFFKVILYALVQLNYILVGLAWNVLGDANIELLEMQSSGVGSIGDTVLSFVSLGVQAFVNVMYIGRGITLVFLIGLYPIFVVSAAFFGLDKIKDYMMELVSNIFLQTFHAFIFFVITLASAQGSPTVFSSTVLMTLMIPMSGAYRELILGKKSGTLQGAAMVGTQASAQVKSMAKQGLSMAGAAAGAVVGGGLMFGADKLSGKSVLDKMRESNQGTSGVAGEGVGVSVTADGGVVGEGVGVDASAGGGSVGAGVSASGEGSGAQGKESSSSDLSKEMVRTAGAQTMRNIAGISQALRRGDANGVYNLLHQNSNTLSRLNDLSKEKAYQRTRENVFNNEMAKVQKDGLNVMGANNNRETMSNDSLSKQGFSNFKDVSGNAESLQMTVDLSKKSTGACIPELELCKDKVEQYNNWVNDYKDDNGSKVKPTEEVQQKWINDNAPMFNKIPEKNKNGTYNVEMNYVTSSMILKGYEK